MTLRKRFVSGVYWNLLEHIILFGLGFFISILIARGLGPANYGIYASVSAVITLISFIFAFGFENIINVYIPQLKTQNDGDTKTSFLLRKIISLRLILSLFLGTVVFFFAQAIASLIKQPEIYIYLRIMSLYIILAGLLTILRMVFRSDLKNKLVTFSESLGNFCFLISVIIFFKFDFGIYGVISSLIISTAVSLLIYIAYFKKEYKSLPSKIENISSFYKLGFVAWTVNFSTFVLGKHVDIVFLNYFKIASEQIGFYSLSFSLLLMLYISAQGLGPIAQSVFSETFAKNGYEGLNKSFKIIYKVNSILLLPLFIFALFNIKPLINIFYTEKFLGAAILFQIFVLFRIIYSVVTAAGYTFSIFYVLNKKRLAFILNLIACSLNLFLDIILIPHFGVMGAVMATGISVSVAGILGIVFVMRQLIFFIPLLFLFKLTMICLIALMPTLLISSRSLPFLILKMFIYGMGIVLLTILIKPIEKDERYMFKGLHPWIDKAFSYINFFELEADL